MHTGTLEVLHNHWQYETSGGALRSFVRALGQFGVTPVEGELQALHLPRLHPPPHQVLASGHLGQLHAVVAGEHPLGVHLLLDSLQPLIVAAPECQLPLWLQEVCL